MNCFLFFNSNKYSKAFKTKSNFLMEDLQQILHVYLSQCDMQPIFGRDREKSFLSGREDLRPREGVSREPPQHTLFFSLPTFCIPDIVPQLYLQTVRVQGFLLTPPPWFLCPSLRGHQRLLWFFGAYVPFDIIGIILSLVLSGYTRT